MFFLSGCSLFTKEVQVPVVQTEPFQIFHPEPPAMIQTYDVEWTVFNRSELEALLKNSSENEQLQFIALTPRGYENLTAVMGDVRRYIEQQREIILYYRRMVPSR